MRRWIIGIVVFLTLAVLALPTAAVYYLAFTESGLDLIVRHMPRNIGRAKLDIGEVNGTLAGGMHISRFEIDHERVHLVFDDVRGRIGIIPLLLQTVRAPDVTMRSALVEIRRRTTPVVKREPRFLPRAFQISIGRVVANEGTLILPNGRQFDLTDVRAAGTIRHKTIRLYDAAFVMGAMSASGEGELRAADPMQIEGTTRLSWRFENQPPWVIATSVDGDLNELALKSLLSSPFRADFAGRALDLVRGWHWEGKARVHDFDIRTWGGSGVLGRVTGELELAGNAQGFKAQGPLTPVGLAVGPFLTSFEGSYGNRVVRAKRIELKHMSSGAQLDGNGEIGIVPSGPRLELAGKWQNFRWPLVGDDVAVRSASGGYTLSGVWPYTLHAGGTISVRNDDRLKNLPVEIVGQLEKGRLIVNEGSVSALDGHARFAAEVDWSPERSWSVSGNAVGVNPAHVRADIPGRLSFAFQAAGKGFSATDDITLQIESLSGQLRNVRASGSGRFARQADNWQFENVRAQLGGTDISVDGRFNGQLDLRFSVRSTDLSLLNSNSRGELHARGIMSGTTRNPIIDATAIGSDILHEGIQIGSFDARIDFSPGSRRKSLIDIEMRDFVFQERKLDRVTFELDGTATQHTVKLDVTAKELKAVSRANGAFLNGVWSGTLQRLDVNGSESLHLELEAPVGLLLSAEAVRLDRACLNGAPVRLCGNGNWNAQSWSAALNANDLPLSTLTAGMTPNVEYRGMINITAEASGSAGKLVDGKLRAELTDAELSHKLASGRIESITLGTGILTANATSEAIRGEIGMDAGPIGRIAGEFAIRRISDRWRDMPLSGTAHAQTSELDFLSIYLPQIDRASGTLALDLAAGGTLGEPLIRGDIKLTEGQLDFYQINLALREVGIEAHLLDNGLDFDGRAKIGTGNAQARGRIQWRGGQPYGRFTLAGDALRVVNVPEVQIDASPDLTFDIEGRKIGVTGTVKIPQARITPADLTNAVRASSDEIIVDEETTEPVQRFEVVSNIDLALGERVSVETSGLRGRLTGNINVRSGADEITRGSGELNIEDGEYTAYGRKLLIQRGRLMFTGGPISDPGVDIRAIKEFPQAIAGINVRGTLLQPRMTFFSEPPLPQSQIVSLILAGGSLAGQTNGASGNDRTGNELLAQGGAILAQQLGARVGIEDVSIEQDLDNETSLVLGKYLSPRLYVSYGISLTESLNTLKLRYTLSDRWTIRTEFSEEGGVDLVYTIDK